MAPKGPKCRQSLLDGLPPEVQRRVIASMPLDTKGAACLAGRTMAQRVWRFSSPQEAVLLARALGEEASVRKVLRAAVVRRMGDGTSGGIVDLASLVVMGADSAAHVRDVVEQLGRLSRWTMDRIVLELALQAVRWRCPLPVGVLDLVSEEWREESWESLAEECGAAGNLRELVRLVGESMFADRDRHLGMRDCGEGCIWRQPSMDTWR
jgi:hypothetical protein